MREYLTGGGFSERSAERVDREDPYWLLLPGWLEEKYAGSGSKDGFLGDVLWAQWSLFVSFRLQDDLFDGDARNLELILVSGLLRLECERVLERHFVDPGFWKLARDYQTETYLAAAEIDRLQKSAGEIATSAVDLYARASSLFKLGSTAVCWRRGARQDLELVTRLCDRLAIAGQIVDDLVDAEEDLGRGRCNFSASRLLGGPGQGVPRPPGLGEAFLVSPGPGVVLDEIGRQLDEAAAVARRLELPPAENLVGGFVEGLDRVRTALHRLRVEIVLGELREAQV